MQILLKGIKFWRDICPYEIFGLALMGTVRALSVFLNPSHPLEKILVPLSLVVCGLTLALDPPKISTIDD